MADTTTPDPIDGDEKAAFEKHQREVASRVQRARMFYWITLAALPFILALIILVFRHGFAIELSANALAIALTGLFVLRTAASTSVIVEVERPLADEITAETRPIERYQLASLLRKNLDAITFSDILMSPLLIFSLALTLDLVSGAWKSAAIGAGWFVTLGLFLMVLNLRKGTSTPAGIRKELCMFGFFIFVLPVILNTLWSPDIVWWSIILETAERLAATLAVMVAVVALITMALIRIEYSLFAGMVRLLPARRKLDKRPVPVRNLVALMEVYLLKEISSAAAASIAVGAVIYWMHDLYPHHIIFLLYSAVAVVPAILAMVIFSKALRIDGQRFIRRLGLQCAAFTLILVNLFLVLGYVAGYFIAQVYRQVFTVFGAYPYPDRFYLFRDISPLDLPFVTQFEALLAAMIILFALSWIVYVVQARAWKEATYVTCLTGAAAGLPYVDFDVIAALSAYMPSLSGLPHWFLAVCIPALKGLITGDVEKLILESDDTNEQLQCSTCSASLDASLGKFCPKCGASVALGGSN